MLLAVLVVGTLRPVNLGAIAFVAAFAVGTLVAGENIRTIYSGFPPDLFILLFGVTYLFGIASMNGTVEWLVNKAAGLVRGNAALVPWIIFFVSVIPAIAGAIGPAATAMLAPIFLRLSKKYDINLRLSGLMLAHGTAAGQFSPLNALGAIVNGTMERNGFVGSPIALFGASFLYNVALGIVIYVAFGGLELLRRTRAGVRQEASEGVSAWDTSAAAKAGMESHGALGVSPTRVVTLLCIIGAAVGAMVFRLDLGMLSVSAAVLLHLFFPSSSKGALNLVSWSTVLLICGIVTYMALLQRMGTITFVGESVANVGSPLIGALVICAIAAATSAFASSAGVLGMLIPLSIPLLSTGQVGIAGVIIALSISATVVDASPFSNVGALVLANCPENEQERMFRHLFLWGMVMVVTAPLATWVVFVLTG